MIKKGLLQYSSSSRKKTAPQYNSNSLNCKNQEKANNSPSYRCAAINKWYRAKGGEGVSKPSKMCREFMPTQFSGVEGGRLEDGVCLGVVLAHNLGTPHTEFMYDSITVSGNRTETSRAVRKLLYDLMPSGFTILSQFFLTKSMGFRLGIFT